LGPPIWKLTGASDPGLIAIVGTFEIVNVTFTTTALDAPDEVMAICPLYVPGANPPPRFATTLSEAGLVGVAVPLLGFTVSQFWP
jgi:hypothetical protein